MKIQIDEIPKECQYCKKRPTKWIGLRRGVLSSIYWASYVCKDHIKEAELEGRRFIGVPI